MNGLYSGQGSVDPSHRAQIPPTALVEVLGVDGISQPTEATKTLDVANGKTASSEWQVFAQEGLSYTLRFK